MAGHHSQSRLEGPDAPRAFRALGGITRLASAIGSLMIVGLMVAINLDVAGRYLFNAPLPGTAEIVAASIVSIVFLQLPDCICSDRMIRSDLVFHRIATRHPRIGAGMDLVFLLLGLAMLSILTWYVFLAVSKAVTSHHLVGVPGVFEMPIWPFYAMVLAGTALSTLEYAALITVDLKKLVRGGAR